MFIPVLNQTLVFIILIFLGYFLAKCKLVPDGADKALSTLEKNIFLPALVLNSFIQQCTLEKLSASWNLLVLGILFIFVVTPISLFVGKNTLKGKDSQKLATYALIFSNFGYMGNAMMYAVFPAYFLDYIIFTLPLTVWMYVWGIPTLLLFDDSKKSVKARLKTLVNPMLICMVVGIAIGLLSIPMPIFVTNSISALADCMSPLAMILTGMVIAKIDIPQFLRKWRIYVLVAIKLFAYPLVYALIFMLIPQGEFITKSVLICGMCYMTMPTGMNPIVIPLSQGKDVSEAAGLALISHVCSVASIPLMFMFLQNFVL